MFGFLKKKPQPFSKMLLDMNDNQFVETVLGSIKSGEPSSGSMIAVAYMNLSVMRSSMMIIAKERGDESTATNIEELIKMLSERQNEDEIKKRRVSWFLLAALIMRSDGIAQKNKELENQAAKMWVQIADGCQFLHRVLEQNAIWSSSEKEWFSLVKNEKDGIDYCLNHVMPKYLKKNHVITEYALEKQIFGWYL
ncbi:MAG: hypothetical protein ACOYJ2_07435 [Rickettsiales bacterium]